MNSTPEITDKGILEFGKELNELPLLKNLELQFWA